MLIFHHAYDTEQSWNQIRLTIETLTFIEVRVRIAKTPTLRESNYAFGIHARVMEWIVFCYQTDCLIDG